MPRVGVVTVITLEWRASSPVDTLFGQLHNELRSEQWDDAAITVAALFAEWQERKIWLALNGSRNAIQDFERQLVRLRAAVEVKDMPLATANAAELTEMWSDFTG